MRVSKLALGIVCGPFICCYVVFAACCCPGTLRRHQEPEVKKHFERRQKVAPRPLPVRPLKRSLTLPLPTHGSEKSTSASPAEPKRGKTLQQTQSRLMSLPLELRQMIFRAVVGDKPMHIVLKENKLGYLKCNELSAVQCPSGWNGRTLRRKCYWRNMDNTGIWSPKRGANERTGTDGDIIPFLQTCRQIYSESIDFLYSTNTFSFSDLDCLRYFSCTTLPKRFDLIRSLDLIWFIRWPIYDFMTQNILLINPSLYPPNDEASWEETWRVIAAMPNLKEITVGLLCYDGFRDAVIEQNLLGPMMKVTNPSSFKVNVSWEGDEVEGAPFELTRVPFQDSVDEWGA